MQLYDDCEGNRTEYKFDDYAPCLISSSAFHFMYIRSYLSTAIRRNKEPKEVERRTVIDS
jgi:hypothetical protein